MNSNAKGKRGELELAAALREHLNIQDARRGQQYCGANGDADVVGWPGVHLEAKRYKRHSCLDFWRQAQNDSNRDDVPVVALRENGDPDQYLLVRLRDLPELCKRVAAIDGKPIHPD